MSEVPFGPSPLPACEACGGRHLQQVLDLGHLPASDALITAARLGEREATAPLRVSRCGDCAMLMLEERLDPVRLFGADYVYSSSVSAQMRTHFAELAEELVASEGLDPGQLVIDVASNDGFLLGEFQQRGMAVLGIEPAPQPAACARQRGVPVIEHFLDPPLAASLSARHPRIVVATNVLAHNPDLNAFTRALTTLAGDGLLVVEVPYLDDLLTGLAFDTIYHEHVFYFSLTALQHLFARHGFALAQVQRVAAQGGSLRLFLRRNARPDSSVESLLAAERRGSLSAARVAGFGARIQALRDRARPLLTGLKAKGARIAAYGAAAKGTILLNVLALGPELIDYVVDHNPLKQGRYIPGVRLPIVADLAEPPPDYLLILPWNLADEIRAQEARWAEAGGRFILPLPDFEILP